LGPTVEFNPLTYSERNQRIFYNAGLFKPKHNSKRSLKATKQS